jgi:hypothetical protein
MVKDPSRVLYQTGSEQDIPVVLVSGKEGIQHCPLPHSLTPVPPPNWSPEFNLWERPCNPGYWVNRAGRLWLGPAVQHQWASDRNMEGFSLEKVSFLPLFPNNLTCLPMQNSYSAGFRKVIGCWESQWPWLRSWRKLGWVHREIKGDYRPLLFLSPKWPWSHWLACFWDYLRVRELFIFLWKELVHLLSPSLGRLIAGVDPKIT